MTDLHLTGHAQEAPPTFELREPGTVAEALELLAIGAPDVRPIAGGTALMLLMRYGYFWPETLVSLRRLDAELGGIAREDDGGLLIGATTTLRQLETSPLIGGDVPVLAAALAHLGNVRVRNVATIGGHLAHADPHMDLPPVLMALDASVRISGRHGARSVAVADLYQGYYETVIDDGELITGARIPATRRGAAAVYRKFCALSADDWPTLGVAVSVLRDGARVTGARLALGAVGARVTRVTEAEDVLDGAVADHDACVEAADVTAAVMIDDPESHAAQLVRVEVRRAVAAALGLDGGSA